MSSLSDLQEPCCIVLLRATCSTISCYLINLPPNLLLWYPQPCEAAATHLVLRLLCKMSVSLKL
jgi:hypothetical protein